MIEIRRILCPIDFSDYSRRALDHPVKIARWYESSITALHVFSPVPVAAYGPGTVGLTRSG
ncbi:MAG: universal stress protein [Acidobacteriota bacterium]